MIERQPLPVLHRMPSSDDLLPAINSLMRMMRAMYEPRFDMARARKEHPYRVERVTRKPKRRRGQRMYIDCPYCWFDLLNGGGLVEGHYEPGLAYFRCPNCHRASLWAIAVPQPYPVPAGTKLNFVPVDHFGQRYVVNAFGFPLTWMARIP